MSSRWRWLPAGLMLALTIGVGASEDGEEPLAPRFSERELRRILSLSPRPALPEDPSNAFADDPRAARFGELLFFDPRLSAEGERTCASCHDPERHWTDGQRTSNPEARFPKNVPTLWNTAYNRWFFWDGRADSAWAQALGPLEHDDEMASNRLRLLHLVRSDPELRASYVEVFGPLPDGVEDSRRFPPEGKPVPEALEHPLHLAWSSMSDEDRHRTNVVFTHLGKALAAFQRQIISPETPFDRFVAGLAADDEAAVPSGGEAVLDDAALRGLKLFVGRGSCMLCHSGPLLSDGEFHDVGIALGAGGRIDPGRYLGVYELSRSPFTRQGRFADAVDPMSPVRFLDQKTQHVGQFKTPSLRGVAETAPYMHDGRFATLEEVVRFYSTREGALPLGHATTLLQPLELDEKEIADLVAFLESLSHEAPATSPGPPSAESSTLSSTSR